MYAILGTGRMASAFAARLASNGQKIVLGSREPGREDVQELVGKLGANASATSIANAAAQADVIILATPYSGMSGVLETVDDLDGKTVIDVTNALKMGGDGLMEMASEASAGEELQSARPKAKIVKAFNTIGFHIVNMPAIAGGPVSTMVAGNDESAKKTAMDLAEQLGFTAVDVGPIRQSRFLEGMSALYLTPYLTGRKDDAFEYFLRQGSSPKESKGVRAAG